VQIPRLPGSKARTYKLKAVTTGIAKGKTLAVKLALPKSVRTAIRRALRARRKVTLTAVVTVFDAAGNKRTLTQKVPIKP
jgi:hypothetical protein